MAIASASAARALGVALALLTVIGTVASVGAPSASAQSAPAAPLQSQDGYLSLCLDANGEPKQGAIDVLLLIDDSGSLEATRNPTDPEKRRFDALGVLLSGFASVGGDARPVNVAAVTFGERVSVELDFAPLVTEDVSRIVAELRSVATGRQRLTLYVQGLRRGVQLLSDRPAENCRILVFFTDGGHDASNRTDAATDLAEAADLRDQFCRPGGLREDLRRQNINLFVLLLTPPEDNPQRLEASKDVMQVLTGDPRPGFVGQDGVARAVPRSPSSGCAGPLGPRTGLILPVAEANQLPGLFADLPNIAGGGVAPIACPYTVGDVTTGALPDGHLVDWLSLTDYGASDSPVAPTLRNLVIVAGDERIAADQVLEPLSESPPSARFRVREDARARLPAGWTIQVIQAQDLCLRLRATVPQFRLSTTEPRVRVVQPRALPEALFADGRLELRDPSSGRPLTIDDALRTASVAGRLRVENGELFNEDGLIPVRVVIDGAPVLGPGCTTIQIPAPGTLAVSTARGSDPEAPLEALQSSTCEITPGTLGDGGVVTWQRTLQQLNEARFECRAGRLIAGEWVVLVDGQPAATDRLELRTGGAPVRIEFRSSAAPENEAVDCVGATVTALQFEWQGRPTEIPVDLSVNWLKRSSPLIAALIATPLALFVVLLSLLLLWLINERYMRPPDASKLWAFEASGTLEVDRRGARIVWEDDAGSPVVTNDTLRKVVTDQRGGLRTEGHSRLARRMPPLYRPLAQPVLELRAEAGDVVVASHPPAPTGRGAIPMGFREAVVLSSRARRLPEPGEEIPVRIVVLVPRDGDTPAESVPRLLEQQLTSLVDRLIERLREVSDAGAVTVGGGPSPSGSDGARPGAGGPPSLDGLGAAGPPSGRPPD
jgi:hypothetical protein